MESRKKVIILSTFFLSMGAIVLLVVSLATDHWVESNPRSALANVTNTEKENSVYFGLFKGKSKLDYGYGLRENDIKVTCDSSEAVCICYQDRRGLSAEDYIQSVTNRTDDEPLYKLGLFNYGYWVTIIFCAAMSIVSGIISMGFSIFNIWGKPIETITGPMGLYVWNGAGFVFTLLEIIMFVVLFLTTWKKNFLLDADIDKFLLEDYTNPGYSFYLIVGSAGLYFVNIILLCSTGYKIRCSFFSEAEKVVDNGVILY